jgi:hypothetical protein
MIALLMAQILAEFSGLHYIDCICLIFGIVYFPIGQLLAWMKQCSSATAAIAQ